MVSDVGSGDDRRRLCVDVAGIGFGFKIASGRGLECSSSRQLFTVCSRVNVRVIMGGGPRNNREPTKVPLPVLAPCILSVSQTFPSEPKCVTADKRSSWLSNGRVSKMAR